MNRRFELDGYKYKNALVFDNSILLSSHFYLSVEDFKHRIKDRKSDKLIKLEDLISFEYLNIGATIFLNLKSGQEKLEFHSEEQKNDFLKLIIDKDLKITNQEFEIVEKTTNKNKTELEDKITFISIFSIIFIIIVAVIYFNEGLKGILKKILFLIGYIIAVISIHTYINQSKFIKYKNTTTNKTENY